jgi:hypothetical protein
VLSDELELLVLSDELESLVFLDELESSDFPDELDLSDAFDELEFSDFPDGLDFLSMLDDESSSMMLADEVRFSSLGDTGWALSVHATKTTKVTNKTRVKKRTPMIINIKKDGHYDRLLFQKGLITFRKEPVPRGGSAYDRACFRCLRWAFRRRIQLHGDGQIQHPAG